MIRRKRRVVITADAMEVLLHHHPGLQAVLYETHAELTWAGRVFVAPLAPAEGVS
jgi:hypothetical protein